MDFEIKFSERVEFETGAEIKDLGAEKERANTIFDEA